jgi:hypothetical protein
MQVLMACLLLSATLAYAADAPAPAAATTAPAKPADIETIKAAFSGMGGMWTSVHDAMDKNDVATAKEVTGEMIKQRETILDTVKGTAFEPLAKIGFAQLEMFQKALANNNVEKAKTLMSGLDVMGESMSRKLEQKDSDAATTKP